MATNSAAEKKLEFLESRIRILTDLSQNFNENVTPKLKEYLKTSAVIFDEDNANTQRAALLDLNSEFSLITHKIKEIVEGDEALAQSLNEIYQELIHVNEIMKQAPDAMYSSANLTQKYGGFENIPAGTMMYENTRESIIRLKSAFRGIGIATRLLSE